MEVILNDYSIDSQFDNIDVFVDSLVNNTFLAFNYIDNESNLLLKSYTTYDNKICESINIYKFLSSQEFMGFPEAQKLRSVLSNLIAEPYWNDNSKTDKQAIYECENIGEFSGDSPNCFSEALERDLVILSFEHVDYEKEKITISKDGKEFELYNLYNEESAVKNLFLLSQLSFVEFLQYSFRNCDIDFYLNGSKFPANEYYESGDLSKDDVLSIKEDFTNLVHGRMCGNILPRLVDSINYRGLTYNEFRTSISNNREFRMYYYVDGKTWLFFDTLIKKTEATPEHIKKKTYDMINKYKSEKNRSN